MEAPLERSLTSVYRGALRFHQKMLRLDRDFYCRYHSWFDLHVRFNEAQGDLQAAKADLSAAKQKYSVTFNDRMQKLDIKINELEQRTDAKSKQAAADLKARRDALSTKAHLIKDRTAADWDAFTKDVDDSFDKLESDVNDALK